MVWWTAMIMIGALQGSIDSFVKSQNLKEAGLQDRLDCWLSNQNANQEACEALGCLWNDSAPTDVPHCFFPRAGYGYKVAQSPPNYQVGFTIDLDRMPARSRFGSDVEHIKFEASYYGSQAEGYNTLRFKFYDPASDRYEVPVLKHLDSKGVPVGYSTQPNRFMFQYGSDEVNGFQFQVLRTTGIKSTIFDSSIGGLTFSDQFLQLATYLPTGCSLYGIGESPHPSYKHDMNYKSWPLFSRDISPMDGYQNLYGVHPFYMCVEADGRAHGLFFVNSNAMEYTTLPAPGVSMRTTGGILDFFLFVGDSPVEVTNLYHKVIGYTFMPPYWALGFQLSRWGYDNLDNLKIVHDRNRHEHLPYDVQYLDIDYMDKRRDFTYDKENFKGLDSFINETKVEGLRWVLILDPAIEAVNDYRPYSEGKDLDLFIHWPKDIPQTRRSNPSGVDTSRDVIYGNVWPDGPVVFPDFFKSGTRDWWKRSIGQLYSDLKFDGLWIDMNEPSNFQTNEAIKKGDPWHLMCPGNKYDDPAYLPLAARTWGDNLRLSMKTTCMASVQGDKGQYRHYDVHSLYGWSEMEPTTRAVRDITGERGMVFSRSTYPSSGTHGGHWLGDNFSQWNNLHRSIIGMLEFNLFGIPYIGADICGFNLNATEEMCQRWMQLGAFYPLCRNHNIKGSIDQDPAAMGGEVLSASIRALKTRYTLLPYLYTLFHAAHTRGSRVINGLMDLYTTDAIARDVDTQFLWGDGLLISPVLNQGQKVVYAYLPDDDWYDYYTGKLVVSCKGGGNAGTNYTVSNLTDTPLHVRGGSILPTQDPAENTATSRKNPFTFQIYPSSKDQTARGEFFWDDGVSINNLPTRNFLSFDLEFNKNKVVLFPGNPNSVFTESTLLKNIIVYNTVTSSKKASINGTTIVNLTCDQSKRSITIETGIQLQEHIGTTTISW